MTPQQQRALRPLLSSAPKHDALGERVRFHVARIIHPLTAQHPAAQTTLTVGALAIGPLLFACTWVRESGETFAEVIKPTGRRI